MKQKQLFFAICSVYSYYSQVITYNYQVEYSEDYETKKKYLEYLICQGFLIKNIYTEKEFCNLSKKWVRRYTEKFVHLNKCVFNADIILGRFNCGRCGRS